jgi:hypothetical protein
MASSDINAYVDYIIALLQDPDAVANTGIQAADVWQGDQQNIPRSPAVCVEPGPQRRELIGAMRQTAVNTDIILMVYVGKVQDVEINQRDAVDAGQKVQDVLHEHSTVGGMAIHSFVTDLDPGYATRAGDLWRAVRLVFNIQTQELLPQAAE